MLLTLLVHAVYMQLNSCYDEQLLSLCSTKKALGGDANTARWLY